MSGSGITREAFAALLARLDTLHDFVDPSRSSLTRDEVLTKLNDGALSTTSYGSLLAGLRDALSSPSTADQPFIDPSKVEKVFEDLVECKQRARIDINYPGDFSPRVIRRLDDPLQFEPRAVLFYELLEDKLGLPEEKSLGKYIMNDFSFYFSAEDGGYYEEDYYGNPTLLGNEDSESSLKFDNATMSCIFLGQKGKSEQDMISTGWFKEVEYNKENRERMNHDCKDRIKAKIKNFFGNKPIKLIIDYSSISLKDLYGKEDIVCNIASTWDSASKLDCTIQDGILNTIQENKQDYKKTLYGLQNLILNNNKVEFNNKNIEIADVETNVNTLSFCIQHGKKNGKRPLNAAPDAKEMQTTCRAFNFDNANEYFDIKRTGDAYQALITNRFNDKDQIKEHVYVFVTGDHLAFLKARLNGVPTIYSVFNAVARKGYFYLYKPAVENVTVEAAKAKIGMLIDNVSNKVKALQGLTEPSIAASSLLSEDVRAAHGGPLQSSPQSSLPQLARTNPAIFDVNISYLNMFVLNIDEETKTLFTEAMDNLRTNIDNLINVGISVNWEDNTRYIYGAYNKITHDIYTCLNSTFIIELCVAKYNALFRDLQQPNIEKKSSDLQNIIQALEGIKTRLGGDMDIDITAVKEKIATTTIKANKSIQDAIHFLNISHNDIELEHNIKTLYVPLLEEIMRIIKNSQSVFNEINDLNTRRSPRQKILKVQKACLYVQEGIHKRIIDLLRQFALKRTREMILAEPTHDDEASRLLHPEVLSLATKIKDFVEALNRLKVSPGEGRKIARQAGGANKDEDHLFAFGSQYYLIDNLTVILNRLQPQPFDKDIPEATTSSQLPRSSSGKFGPIDIDSYTSSSEKDTKLIEYFQKLDEKYRFVQQFDLDVEELDVKKPDYIEYLTYVKKDLILLVYDNGGNVGILDKTEAQPQAIVDAQTGTEEEDIRSLQELTLEEYEKSETEIIPILVKVLQWYNTKHDDYKHMYDPIPDIFTVNNNILTAYLDFVKQLTSTPESMVESKQPEYPDTDPSSALDFPDDSDDEGYDGKRGGATRKMKLSDYHKKYYPTYYKLYYL